MSDYIFQIYDRIFKKILTLSTKAVINMINGLFNTDYPLDSELEYNWTEFHDDSLKKTLADTILTINKKHSYHMEAQMTQDYAIVFRILDYGFNHANRNSYVEDNLYVLPFPEPVVIYLAEGKMHEHTSLKIDFGTQGNFMYKIPVVNYLQLSKEELEQKNMIILIPFQLIRMRKIIEKDRSREQLEALKSIIWNDIIKGIDKNLEIGNITESDARKLRRLTHLLYENLYSHYEEMEELTEMTDESLMLDIDIIEKEHEKEIEEVTKEVTKEVTNTVRKQTKNILRLSAEGHTIPEIAEHLGLEEEVVKETLID